MPYYITKYHPDCESGWATVKENYEMLGCHQTKREAIAQMVALSTSEGLEPGGEHPRDKRRKEAAKASYSPPAGVQSAAKRALKWIADGKAGKGFTDVGRKRASQLASGQAVSLSTVKRMRSYFARHTVDRRANGFFAGEKDYPTPGRVAWDAWGGDAGRTWVNNLDLGD